MKYVVLILYIIWSIVSVIDILKKRKTNEMCTLLTWQWIGWSLIGLLFLFIYLCETYW